MQVCAAYTACFSVYTIFLTKYPTISRGVIKSSAAVDRNFNNTALSSSRASLEEASLLAQNGRQPIYYSGGIQRTPS